MATQPQVTEIIMMLADAYSKEFQNPKGYLETAARLLVNVPADELRRAAEAHIEASKFFPTIAELKSSIRKLPVQAEGPQERPLTPIQAIEAQRWGVFMGDRSECRRIEKFEWYTCMSDCPVEDRAEYQAWLDWAGNKPGQQYDEYADWTRQSAAVMA